MCALEGVRKAKWDGIKGMELVDFNQKTSPLHLKVILSETFTKILNAAVHSFVIKHARAFLSCALKSLKRLVALFAWLLILWLFGDLGPVLMYVCQCFSPDTAPRRRWSRLRASRSGFTLLVFASLTGLAETNKHHTPTHIPLHLTLWKKTLIVLPRHTKTYGVIWILILMPFSFTTQILCILGRRKCAPKQLNLKPK